MAGTKSTIAMLMGIIILVADLYWTSISLNYTVGLALGVIILLADIIWLVVDYQMMKK